MTKDHHVQFPAPTTWIEEVRSKADLPQDLVIYDGTLRKMLSTAGISPSVDDMLFIAEQLERLGVQHVMMNVFWSGDARPNEREYSVCKAVLERGFAFDVSVYADAFVPMSVFDSQGTAPDPREAMALMAEAGMKYVTPVLVDPRDADRRRRMEEDLDVALTWIADNDLRAVLCIGDPARADYDYIIKVCNDAVARGVERIDLHDTASSLSPEAARLFFSTFIRDLVTPVPVTCHIHDDFGMATAATVSAVAGGAHPDVSLLGVSYRSGFAALEEVVVALEVLYGADTGLRLEFLADVCEKVADRVGLARDTLKAVVGRNQFLRNLPLWAVPFFLPDGPAHPASVYDPAMIGRSIKVVWDHNFSKHMLRLKATSLGLRLEAEELEGVERTIRARIAAGTTDPRYVEDEEVAELLRGVRAAS